MAMDINFKKSLMSLGVDVNRAVRDYFVGNEDMFVMIIKNNILAEDLMKETYDALDVGDIKAAFNATHKLKSQLGYFCYDHVNTNVKAACEIFRANKSEGARELLDEVKEDYYDFISCCKDYLF